MYDQFLSIKSLFTARDKYCITGILLQQITAKYLNCDKTECSYNL
jgi:hypothetical protein